jgi:hypothetical protein
LRNAKIFYQMKDNELLEHLRWIDIPDCKKYKDLLESEDREVVKFAIELLTVDGVEKRQIDRCRERFLHEYRWDEKWSKSIVWYEPEHNISIVPIVV